MSRRPIGDAVMSAAERQKRRRDKAKALRDVAQKPIQSAPTQPACTPSPAERPANTGQDNPAQPAVNGLAPACMQPPPFNLLAADAETIAARIFEAVPPEKAERVVTALNRRIGGDADAIATRLLAGVGTEMARDVAMALQRHLLQGGSWPSWARPLLS